ESGAIHGRSSPWTRTSGEADGGARSRRQLNQPGLRVEAPEVDFAREQRPSLLAYPRRGARRCAPAAWPYAMHMVATPEAAHPQAVAHEDISGLYAHFIGGRLLRPDGSPDLVRTNPAASDEVLGGLRSADIELVNAAVRTAAEAWPKWRNTPAPARGQVLLEAARLMDKHRDELARLISIEEGKALKDSRAEVQRSINITEFMAGEGRRFGGYSSASESATKFAFTT